MTRANENLSPAMRQFQHFKAKHPDCILFFRMGDFYETFYEDAKTCSELLDLTLTARSKEKDRPRAFTGTSCRSDDTRCISTFLPSKVSVYFL